MGSIYFRIGLAFRCFLASMNSLPPQSILDRWFPGQQITAIDPVGGGLSGASVWRISVAGLVKVETWALKCWPEGSRVERVSEIHGVLKTARANRCPAIPEALELVNPPSSWMNAGGRIWESSKWSEGQPADLHQHLEQTVEELATWVARFASSVEVLGRSRGVPKTIVDRRQRFEGLSRTLKSPIAIGGLGQTNTYNEKQKHALCRAIQVLDWTWPRAAPELGLALISWTQEKLDLQYVVRDVHFGNTLFLRGKLIAFVDFDAVRMDTPASDLSRLVGSVLLERSGEVDADAVWVVALAAYRRVRPLSLSEESLAKWLAEINPLINLANWVVWLAIEGRDFGESQEMAFQRLEKWSAVVAMQFGVTPESLGW